MLIATTNMPAWYYYLQMIQLLRINYLKFHCCKT